MSDNFSNYSNESLNDSFERYLNNFNNSYEKNQYFQQELEFFTVETEKTQETNNEKETALKILEDSFFTIDVNKKGEEQFINYGDINYDNGLKQIPFEELKNVKINDKSEILETNYQKFLDFLEDIVNYMKKEFNNNYTFKIDLIFKMENKNNKKKSQDNLSFKIDCLYRVHIPSEEVMEFKDNNILVNGASEGLISLINEIKYGNYEF